jgi:gluconolactonase
MSKREVARTLFSPLFSDVIAAGATMIAMPGGCDVGGGDSAGWGRGLCAPVWHAELGGISFSDTAHHRRLCWVPGNVPELLSRTNGAITGCVIDGQGGTVWCDWAGRRVIAERAGGPAEALADAFEGIRFNRPGAICAGLEDDFFFIDQRLPFPPNEPDLETIAHSGVYHISALGVVSDTGIKIDLPGGIALDAKKSRLLVSEPRNKVIHAFALGSGGTTVPSQSPVLATLDGPGKGKPHGLAVDDQGRIFVGGPGGVWILDANGNPLGIAHLTASRVTGLAIGGGRLWITTPVGVGFIELAKSAAEAQPTPSGPALLRQPLGFDQLIERHDPAFDRIIAPDVRIANHGSGGFFDDLGGGEDELYSRSLEGLFWDSREACLMFSDIGNSRRMRLTPSTGAITQAHFPTGFTNGATLDRAGNILSCEHAGRRISRRMPNGEVFTVVDRTDDGRKLNHPNDITLRSDGNIYFTDPWWDFGAGEKSEIGHAATWHLSPEGKLQEFAGDWIVCNGLALSVDEKTLFVNDTYKFHIRAFDILPDGQIDSSSDRVFCELNGAGEGKPDGIKLDMAGNVYCGGPGGLWVFSPEGKHLGTIAHGATQTNNLCFGGPDWQTLYFCSWTSIHSVPLLIPGVRTLDAV